MINVSLLAIVLSTVVSAKPAVPTVRSEHLDVRLDPAAHWVSVVATLETDGTGPLNLRLNEGLVIDSILAGDRQIDVEKARRKAGGYFDGPFLRVNMRPREHLLTITAHATLEQDVEAGEVAGAIHNFSVNAHIGEEGIFLSDGSGWYPHPLDAKGNSQLIPVSVRVQPMDGWYIVGSGDPDDGSAALDAPCWAWKTPRPVDGMALVGNQHVARGMVHQTVHGPVEIVMQVAPHNESKLPLFMDAAAHYLDLYVPRLGPFPYQRMTIVENFFSSGFAYPGFTVLGPQVVGMGSRSLHPGYLDHEMLHNWWGNGVYVDTKDGNWCEALTSYCTNYSRRILDAEAAGEDAEEVARNYRRGILMRLATDPDGLNRGALGDFGVKGGIDRFVAYDKGAFVFFMLERMLPGENSAERRRLMWEILARFSREHLGQRANWTDFHLLFAQYTQHEMHPFIEQWVRGDFLPQTVPTTASDIDKKFIAQYQHHADLGIERGRENGKQWVEIDPNFHLYRLIPAEQIIPTIAGTMGPGGMQVVTRSEVSSAKSFHRTTEVDENGENMLILGREALADFQDQINASGDPITVGEGSFTVGGVLYDGPNQSVLHTMPYAGSPGRFITIFLSNGKVGWQKLRLIRFYKRDSTVIWDGQDVIQRRTFEPDRRIWIDS